MPVQLFRLRHVPDDETEDIRQLLHDHGIDFYETSAGSWGISMPAIWLHDESLLPQAQAHIDAYQKQRATLAQQAYAELKATGKQRTSFDMLREKPLQFTLLLIAIGFILYISTSPFIHFLEPS